MTADEFIQLAQPQEKIELPQMYAIEQFAGEMPWFANAQILLLKAMKQHRHSFFEERLAYTSLYATRRDQLASFLQRIKECPEPAPLSKKHSLHNNIALGDDDGFELLDNEE